jgi:hypothetical protein
MSRYCTGNPLDTNQALVVLVPTTWRRCAVLLLAWVTTSLRRRPTTTSLRRVLAGWCAVLALRGLAVLSLRRRCTVLRLALRRLTILALGRRCTVLSLRWCAVLSLRWCAVLRLLLAVALLGRSAVLAARRSAVATSRVGLLVLGVVAAVDGAEEELDDPQIGGEVDGRVGTGHLFLLILEV